MKKIVVVLAVAALLAVVGCAKQPVATEATVSEQPVASGQVQGADQSSVTGSAVQDSAMTPDGLQRVYFDFDQYTLSDDAKAALEANAAFLMAKPSVQIKIDGHCDERGSDEYNLALGEKRALAVMNYLVSLGVAKERLSVISYGEERPLVAASTAEAYAQNRRAEFIAQ